MDVSRHGQRVTGHRPVGSISGIFRLKSQAQADLWGPAQPGYCPSGLTPLLVDKTPRSEMGR